MFLRIRRLSAKKDIRFARISQIVARLQFALLMVVLSLGIGTAGFVFIENYPLLDAWYMSVITLASVGFGEIHPLSNAGRLFTSFLILFNVGLFAYSISTIIGIFTEGGLARLMSDYQMDQQIKKLSGHTIVCGFGRHATEVAQELAKHQIPFVVIENHLGKAEKSGKKRDTCLSKAMPPRITFWKQRALSGPPRSSPPCPATQTTCSS
ncbi:MAG: hypothetical protein IPK76_12860 [Lewinellaceae bacterium]|nr:hypothetical protein [Lewinellaceae bacterium]